MHKERLVTLALIVLAAAMARLLPHPANVAPIAAIALFSGARFNSKALAFAVPFAALLLSDAIIGFYSQIWVTYLAFAVIVCIGFLLQGNNKPADIYLGAFSGSVLFFLITNFALWPGYALYPQTAEGVLASYTAALPFFRNALFGDLFYTTLLFGGLALAERKFASLKSAAA